ncbi:MAG: S1/P1 nuclease [Flavobacteriaceae bacterium]
MYILRSGIIAMVLVSQWGYAHDAPVWSKTGHRTIGQVAEHYLKKRTKRALNKLLGGRDLASVANFADEIKADTLFRKFNAWHYVNLPPDKDYGEVTPSPYGDLVTGIQTCIEKVGNGELPEEQRSFYLKMLIHLIGDLHQPMHVGRLEDKGGNDFQLLWFGKGTNLHKVWDAHLINDQGMSYSEMANSFPKLSRRQVEHWQGGALLDWVHESRDLATKVYAGTHIGEKLYYRYGYDWWPIAERQLQKGGVRLAKVLNDLF